MATKLFRHPFAVEAFFQHSLVLAYAVPIEQLAAKLPPYLEVDSYADTYGFVAAAFVDTRQLRPKGFPRWLGNDFILGGYRIFVRYRDARGRRLRGLYILRSETDRLRMRLLGNLFTAYNYHRVPLTFSATPESIVVTAPGRVRVVASISEPIESVALPNGSPFPSWKEARRFSGPLPYTFSYDSSRSEMVIVEGVREGWQPRPVSILQAHVLTIAELGFPDAQLANAFLVSAIPYCWKTGVIERLPHKARNDRLVNHSPSTESTDQPGVGAARSIGSDDKSPPSRTPFMGVWNVFRFNYELFAFAVVVVAACFILRLLVEPGVLASGFLILAVAVSASTLLSLVVSWWVYDHSALYRLSWLDPILGDAVGPALNIHAGFDETSAALANRYPQLAFQVMDFYDPERHTERSIKRARAVQSPYPGTKRVSPLNLELPVNHYSAVFLLLAIHEIREDDERISFLRQLREALATDGKVIVIEHVRDAANFIAYTIGFLHFLSPRSLRNGFSKAGFRVASEGRLTPFLRVFVLE